MANSIGRISALLICALFLQWTPCGPNLAFAEQHCGIDGQCVYGAPPEVFPRAGCDFNGHCNIFHTHYSFPSDADGTITYRDPDKLFMCEAGRNWKIAPQPADASAAPGVTFTGMKGKLHLDLRYYPASGIYAGRHLSVSVPMSPQQFYRAEIQHAAAAQMERKDAESELPVMASRLLAGVWTGAGWFAQTAYEFSYAYGGSARGAPQRQGQGRIRVDLVLIPAQEGMFVVTYRIDEQLFPNGVAAFQALLGSLRINADAAPATGAELALPRFPALQLIAGLDGKKLEMEAPH